MNKYLKILFGVLLLVAIVEAFVFFSDRLPGGLHACKFATLSADKKNIGCTAHYGQGPLEGNLLALTVKSVKKEENDVYITVNFPLFFGTSLPMKLRAGKLQTEKGGQKIGTCVTIGREFESGHNCKFVTPESLAATIKPGWFIVTEFFPNDAVLIKDPAYRCREGQGKFISSVRKNESALSFLPYFGKASCIPTIGQIFYGFSSK